MAIQSIELKNFTVFENIKCKFSPGINIFIGENGTGKTHMLKVLYAFCNASIRDKDYEIASELRPLFDSQPRIRGILNKNMEENIELRIERGNKSCTYILSLEDDSAGYHVLSLGNKLPNDVFSTFIPAKEMLSISNITRIDEKFDKELAMDKSLLNIIKKAQNMKLSNPPEIAKKIAPKLEAVMGGTVFVKESDNNFWIRKTSGDEVLFSMEAEGIRKFGLIWQLIMNGSLASGNILFWDEPEANLNPKLIPVIVDVLMELARNGVQIFLATHEYNLMKYFSLKKKESDNVAFISMYKTGNGVESETEEDYTLLEHNAIVDADIKLLEDDIEGVLSDAN